MALVSVILPEMSSLFDLNPYFVPTDRPACIQMPVG